MASRYGGITGSKKISEDFQNINTAFENVQTEMDANKYVVDNHLTSTTAHKAEDITYTGPIPGGDVKEAIDNVNGRISEIVAQAGDDNTEIVDARGGYTVLGDRLNALDAEKADKVWFNVKDFGAVGDGLTDDTEAIRSAINMAVLNGGTVYFPSDTYLVTDTINITGHKYKIIGEDAQTYIKFSPLDDRDCFYGSGSVANNIRIADLSFLDGTSALEAGSFIHLIDATQCRIENCEFNGGNIGVWAERGNGLSIHRNYFEGQKTAIQIESNDPNNKILDTQITQNYIRDCITRGISGLEYAEGVFIRENILYKNGINIYLSASAPSRLLSVKIQENDIDTGTNKGLNMVYVSNFQVSGNWVSNCTHYSCQMDSCSSGVFSANLIYPKFTGNDTNYGLYLEGCDTVTVTGNTISGGDGGIRIDRTNLSASKACKGINMTANIIANCPLGVHLYNSNPLSDGVTIASNIFQSVATSVGDAGTLHFVNANNNSF